MDKRNTNPIQYIHVLDAINRVNGWRDSFKMGPLERQLSMALRLYRDRGEFDGTVDSAYACLTLAGYVLAERDLTQDLITEETDNEKQ